MNTANFYTDLVGETVEIYTFQPGDKAPQLRFRGVVRGAWLAADTPSLLLAQDGSDGPIAHHWPKTHGVKANDILVVPLYFNGDNYFIRVISTKEGS